MKKMLIIFIMIGLCIGFFFMVNNRKFETTDKSKKIDIEANLKEQNEKLDKNYPSEPKEIIEIHNQLMSYLYSQNMKDEYIELYVDTVRKLYDKELLDLNTKIDQKNFIIMDREKNKEKPMKLLGSKIEEVTINNAEAEIKVIHYLDKGDLSRIYTLKRESGLWKILSWESAKENSDNAEE